MSPPALALAAGAYAATNADGFLTLTAFLTAGQEAGPGQAARIWAGQFFGTGVLVALSLLGAKAAAGVPLEWLGWAGLVPIAVGAAGLLRFSSKRTGPFQQLPSRGGTVLAVSAATVSAGADNIAVYVPLFRGLGTADAAIAVACFAALTLAWCAAATAIGRIPPVARLAAAAGAQLAPFAYLGIGGIVLARPLFTG
jgi:cadmium resistance protein CadD (predicted permease)